MTRPADAEAKETERRWWIAEDGIRQIERFGREEDACTAETVFNLTADGLFNFADGPQKARLRGLARKLGVRDPFWAERPHEALENLKPSRHGLH